MRLYKTAIRHPENRPHHRRDTISRKSQSIYATSSPHVEGVPYPMMDGIRVTTSKRLSQLRIVPEYLYVIGVNSLGTRRVPERQFVDGAICCGDALYHAAITVNIQLYKLRTIVGAASHIVADFNAKCRIPTRDGRKNFDRVSTYLRIFETAIDNQINLSISNATKQKKNRANCKHPRFHNHPPTLA